MEREAFIKAIEKGLNQIKNGEVTSHEEVKRWVLMKKKKVISLNKSNPLGRC